MPWFASIRSAGVVLLVGTMAALAADKDDGIVVDKEKRTITIPVKVAPRKIDDPGYKEVYPVEVIATWPFRKEPPGGQKAHETIVTFDFAVKPSDIHKALESIGVKPGKPALGEGDGEKMPTAEGPKVNIFLEFPGIDGSPKRVPIEKTIVSRDNPKLPLPKMEWRFTGSVMKKFADKKDEVYGADTSGTLISIFPVTDTTVFQSNLTMKEEKLVKIEANKTLLPKEGTPCKLVIEVPK